ncbi:pro-MCH 2-like [Carassius carassius]|uniref:pro-MCH 2-like n=1 Tax=Carassius carassius TaxID=217509 RepID=UPI0028685ED0|nr:pro-MCH 2-like [Carassius carassius]
MASSYIVIFALAVLVELTTRTTTALPKVKMDGENTDQDRAVSTEGEDDLSEMGPGRLIFRRQPIIEGRLVDEDGTNRIFILADTGIKGSLGRETNLAFSRTFPVLPPSGMDHILDGFNMRDERRSTDNAIPMGRSDILRCMIGRVYRPCWQA